MAQGLEVSGGHDREPDLRSRTSCCGMGAYALVFGVYLIMNPRAERPTQTAERIGGFRGCSKCFKPLGHFAVKPPWEISRDLWVSMLNRAESHGTSAYWAQKNDDGTFSLYDWNAHPFRAEIDGRSLDQIAREAEKKAQMPQGESALDKKNRALAKAQQFNLLQVKETPDVGDAQEEPPAKDYDSGGMEEVPF